jgi:hypothetical protein
MVISKFDTKYYQINDARVASGQIGSTPHCVYVHYSRDEALELLDRLLDYIKEDEADETFDLCLSCELKPCGLWEMEMQKET